MDWRSVSQVERACPDDDATGGFYSPAVAQMKELDHGSKGVES